MTDNTEHNEYVMLTALRLVAHADGGVLLPNEHSFKEALKALQAEGLVECIRLWRPTKAGLKAVDEENKRLGIHP